MKTRWHLVLFLVLGSVFVSCAEEALDQAMVPDGGDDGDGRVSHADVPAEAGACCEPPPPPARTVLFDETIPSGTCFTPTLDISAYRRVIVHSACGSGANTEFLEFRHGVAGFLKLTSGGRLCESPAYEHLLSVDPQLGSEIRIAFSYCSAAHPVTIVGYR